MAGRLLPVLLWLDIKVLVLITLGNCRKGETISAASWSLYLDGKWQGKLAVRIIDWLALKVGDGPDHCQRAYEWQISIYAKD
jgi:hypothetical protein